MHPVFAQLARRYIKYQLARTSSKKLLELGEQKVLTAFARAARLAPAYGVLLQESNLRANAVQSASDFVRLCPILEKANTFQRFRLEELMVRSVKPASLASILTSSGQGHNGFAVGLSTANQFKATPFQIDLGLELAFNVDSKRSLLINCLPMGVTFLSDAVCVANVSVREDMACAIVQQAGHLFEQIILCGDPLFLKRLCDYSRQQKIDWQRYRMHVIIGEETFAESFRSYLAHCLSIDQNGPGLIGSSMGVGELGLNLFNETRETIAIRRACAENPALLPALLGQQCQQLPLPTFMCFNPLRTFVEIVNQDQSGAGELVLSLLDLQAPVPLMRYKTGDRAMFVDPEKFARVFQQQTHDLRLPVFPVIALLGRSRDWIDGEWHVDFFKQALYSKPEVADVISGAFRVSQPTETLLWEVQMRQASGADLVTLGQALTDQLKKLNKKNLPAVRCFSYQDFPYGQTLDYERKFPYLSR